MFYQRKSPRASWHDYHSEGMYFITICTKEKECYFWGIVDWEVNLSEIGKVCEEELHIMLQKRPFVKVDEYIIMPNHVHILLEICRDDGLPRPNDWTKCYEDNASVVPTKVVPTKFETLWSIIGWRKSAVSKKCHELWHSFTRQSRYHDHIIRDETGYLNIKQYIQDNPLKRKEDSFYI